MTNQQENKDRVLDAVRNLVHAANGHLNLGSAVSEYIRATSFLSVAKLEDWERAFRYEIYVEPHSSSKLFTLRDRRLPIPWLDLCHGDGYLREKALRSLREGAPNGFLLAMVLRRLNDWVPQVRAAARISAKEVLEKSDAEIVVSVAWMCLFSRREGSNLFCDCLVHLSWIHYACVLGGEFVLYHVVVCWYFILFFFFFKQKTAYEIGTGDWSSDVCSSDLLFLF